MLRTEIQDGMSPGRAAGLSALVAVLVCLPALFGEFVIDDAYLIVGHQGIRSLGNTLRFFVEPWGGGEGPAGHVSTNAAYYRPLTTLLLSVEHAMFGLRPWGWHLVSILLHAGASAFAVALSSRLLPSTGAALFAGLLFAVHPVHTEAIAASCYQTTLLAALLAMAALWVLGLGLDGRWRVGRAAVLAAMLAGLAALAKEEGAAVVLLAWAGVVLAPGGASRRGKAALLGGLTAAVGVALLARMMVVPGSNDSFFGEAGLAVVAMTMLRVVVLYARLLVAPVVLCPFYDWFIVPPSSDVSPESVLGLVLAAGLVPAVLALRRRAPAAAVGLCWLALALVPVMHIVPILNVAAERFLYLPSVGFAFAMAALFTWGRKHRPNLALGFAVVVVALFATRTLTRWADWRDDRVLNQATAKDFPETPTPLLNLAQIEVAAGNPVAALDHLERAARRAPGWDVPLKRAAQIRSRMRP
jgi:hypothetical protein